jgi:DNA-binding IclR family transcriptional regulator
MRRLPGENCWPDIQQGDNMRKKWVPEDKRVIATRPGLPDGVVKSAGRVLAILEYFDEIQRPANVVEIAETLELPQSSTSALLRSLATIGYLHFNRTARTYLPSCRVSLLGNWVSTPLVSEGAAQRCMEDLQRKTGNAVVLAVRNGVWSQYIHVLQSTTTKRLHLPRGALRPIGASGTGFAILSTLSDTEVRKIAHRINAEASLGESAVTSVETAALLERVGLVRRQGYSHTADLVTQGGALLAMPLPITDGGQALVVGMGGSSVVFQERRDEFVALMRETIQSHFPPPPLPAVRRFESGVAVPGLPTSTFSWPLPSSPMPAGRATSGRERVAP